MKILNDSEKLDENTPFSDDILHNREKFGNSLKNLSNYSDH